MVDRPFTSAKIAFGDLSAAISFGRPYRSANWTGVSSMGTASSRDKKVTRRVGIHLWRADCVPGAPAEQKRQSVIFAPLVVSLVLYAPATKVGVMAKEVAPSGARRTKLSHELCPPRLVTIIFDEQTLMSAAGARVPINGNPETGQNTRRTLERHT